MSETNQLQFFNGRIVCPRCDGNGLVYKAKVSDLNKILYICDECEASWQEDCHRRDIIDPGSPE
jgi:transposase-like protein